MFGFTVTGLDGTPVKFTVDHQKSAEKVSMEGGEERKVTGAELTMECKGVTESFFGASILNPRDIYDASKGRKVAFKNALENFENWANVRLNKEIAKEIWHKYRTQEALERVREAANDIPGFQEVRLEIA